MIYFKNFLHFSGLWCRTNVFGYWRGIRSSKQWYTKKKNSNKAALCHYFEEHARCWECKILQSIIFVLTALVASVVVSCATHDKSWSHYPIEPWEGHSTSHLSIQYKHCADGCPFRMIVVSPLQFCTTNPLLFPLEWASNKSSGSTLPFL